MIIGAYVFQAEMAGKKKQENGTKLDSRTLEKRFSTVRDSAEDIQSVSRWCLQNKTQYHSIVQAWARALRKGLIFSRMFTGMLLNLLSLLCSYLFI